MIQVAKNCLSCNRPVKGRADKKFCDDSCRNNYNNRLNSDSSVLVRNINNALRKNRRILESVLDEDRKTVMVNKKLLLEKGFHFQYITHTLTTGNGTYYYCYDYGYLPLPEKDVFLVVKKLPALR